MRHTLLTAGVLAVALLFLPQGIVCDAQVSVLTQYNDSARDGLNSNEISLTLSSVNPGSFGKLFNLPVDGYVYAQPLYVSNVVIPGNGTHNVVYIATMHDSLYAYDADGQSLQPLWQVSLAALGCPGTWTCTSITTADEYLGSTDIVPEIGILSTPVIDSATNTIYVVAKTKEVSGSTTNYLYRLHALDITTGMERSGSPVVIQGQVPGSGNPNSVGYLIFSPHYSLQRSGLTLVNNGIYMAFGSAGDDDMWHGWVFGYDKTTFSQLGAFSTTPNGSEGHGGIWMHGNGLASDSAGNLYLTTGNGAFDGIGNFGNAFVKLATPGLALTDYFAPYNQQTLDSGDLDVSSGAVVLLPDSAGTVQHPHIMIGCGKNGALYVLDRDVMGHFNSAGDSQIIQELLNVVGSTTNVNPLSNAYVPNCFSSAAYWQGQVYFVGVKDSVKAFNFSGGLLSNSATSQSTGTYGYPGASVSISANGASQGIAWTIEKPSTGSAVLHAFDATNLSSELYNSSRTATDAAGAPVKFVIPTIANGKVFVGTQTSVAVYGLFSSMPQAAAPSFNPPGGTYSGPTSVTIDESTTGTTVYYTTDGSMPTTSSSVYTGPLVIMGTETLSAIAVGDGYRQSSVTTATYVPGHPTVTSVSPNTGPQGGGTAVVITGTNFVAGATVTFGSSAASNVTVVSSTQITATTTAGAPGVVTLTVSVGGQNGTLPSGFTYVAGPSVSSVSPTSGAVAGGTAVNITGTNFTPGATVNFGSSPATKVTVVNSTSITATTRSGTAGTVNVTVTCSGQSGMLSDGFTYATLPKVTGVSPNTGSIGGGTTITITGTNFAAGATVTIGSKPATSVVVVNSTTITAVTPASAAGTFGVGVKNSNGMSGNLAKAFTYASPIKFVQVAALSQTSTAQIVAVAFPGAQTQGNLNIVVIGWADLTSTVQTVRDTDGNSYQLAITTKGTGLQQSIYYASNILGTSSNTVTVTFNQQAVSPDVRVAEYQGVTTLDVTSGKKGTSASANSGAVTTTSAVELIFGADYISTQTKSTPAALTLRIVTTPGSNLVEDKVTSAVGSMSVSSTLTASGPWVMQMAAFK